MIKVSILPAPKLLSEYVVCFRIAHYEGDRPLSIRVSPNGHPGLIFQSALDGNSAIESIITSSKDTYSRVLPSLFLHGIISELSTMQFVAGSYTTIQVILQPQAVHALFRRRASTLAGESIAAVFGAETLNKQLKTVSSDKDRVKLMSDYLTDLLHEALPIDMLIQRSLSFIESHIDDIQVGILLENAAISPRQFNRRFLEAVGVSPQWYIRIKRFNKAMDLINDGDYARLIDIAMALHYHDQSHFIRDLKLFTGITPKNISQKVTDFSKDKAVFAYYNDAF